MSTYGYFDDEYFDRKSKSESFVQQVLRDEKSAPELMDKALEAFLGTRMHEYEAHGSWVHSLSHFTERLWDRRLDGWIKRLNEVAFEGANELDDYNCCERLAEDFGKYARFDDDPVDFALTPENLRWGDWKYPSEYARARIDAGRFPTEGAFIRWQLRSPDCNERRNLVVGGIRSLVLRLYEIDEETDEDRDLERALLTKRLGELETELIAETKSYDREQLEKQIQKTRIALASGSIDDFLKRFPRKRGRRIH